MRRSTLLLVCLCAPIVGCGRNASADNIDSPKTDAVSRPVAIVAPPDVSLGEDANSKRVNTASLEAIRASLKNPDPTVRRTAIKDLAAVRWKLPESVGDIVKLALDDADPGVRLEALRIAATDPLRVGDVARLLHDKDAHVRLTAARLLVVQGKHESDAYPVLVEVLRDRKAGERQAVLDVLRDKAPVSRPATPVLIAMSLDASDPLRAAAIDVLGRLDAEQEAVDALLLTAHEAEPKARAAALRALGRLDPVSAKVQVALVKALREPNVDLRLAAAEGVGKDGIPQLIELLRQGDERLRDASVRALGRIGPDAWAAGADLQRLAQGDPSERIRNSAKMALHAVVPPILGN
jgi:HEAT repeat protein